MCAKWCYSFPAITHLSLPYCEDVDTSYKNANCTGKYCTFLSIHVLRYNQIILWRNRTYIRSLTVEIIVRHSVHHYWWLGGHFLFCRSELNLCSSQLSRAEQFCFSGSFRGCHLFLFCGRYIFWLIVRIIDVEVITVCSF